MKRASCLLWILLSACGSTSSSDEERRPQLVGEADFKVAKVASAAEHDASFRLGATEDKPPEALGRRLQQGRHWLRIRQPLGLSFAGIDLLEGERAFKPASASISLAWQTSGSAASQPALLRLEGWIGRAVAAALFEKIDEPGVEDRGLDHIDDQNLRLLLGNGIDTILEMTSEMEGGSTEFDSREWMDVVGPDGKPYPNWIELAQAAIRDRSLEGLKGYHVIAMRYRATAKPKEAYFRIGLDLLGLAAQMDVKPEDTGFRWVWEGLWRGDLEVNPPATTAPQWPDAPRFTLHYKEYRPGRRQMGGAWHTLLKPITLPINYAAKAFDPYEGERDADKKDWK